MLLNNISIMDTDQNTPEHTGSGGITTILVPHNGYVVRVAFLRNNISDPEAVTWICLHGNSASSLIFVPLLERFSLCGIPAIAVDLIGHGNSSAMKCSTTKSIVIPTLKDQVSIMWNLVDQLGLKNVVLLGHSMGGHIALQMAIADQHNDRYRRTVGIMTSGTPPTAVDVKLKAELPEPWLTSEKMKPLYPLLIKLNTMTLDESEMFAEHQGFAGIDLKIFSGLAHQVRGGARNIANNILAGYMDEAKFFMKTTLPVALIHAEKDGAVNLQYLEALVKKRKELGNPVVFDGVVTISGARHAVIWNQPGKFFEYVIGMNSEL